MNLPGSVGCAHSDVLMNMLSCRIVSSTSSTLSSHSHTCSGFMSSFTTTAQGRILCTFGAGDISKAISSLKKEKPRRALLVYCARRRSADNNTGYEYHFCRNDNYEHYLSSGARRSCHRSPAAASGGSASPHCRYLPIQSLPSI